MSINLINRKKVTLNTTQKVVLNVMMKNLSF